MKVLYDTHTLLWAAFNPGKLSSKALAIAVDETNEIFVSAASAWEIAMKVRLGKLPGAEAFEQRFLEAVEDAGYTLLAIDAAIALRAGRLIDKHGDPFDRMIAAQALADDLLLLSNDTKLDSFGVRRLW